MAQLVCSSPACRVVLMYPRGASQVQCSICGTVNCAMAVGTPVFSSVVLGCRCVLCQA
jgi:LSD1 subclass zinc finger protein